MRGGGHLAYVHNEAERKAMFTYMNKDYENNMYWMGINDIVEEDKFVWADGTDANDDFAKSLWRWKQPNNWQDQDCGVIGYEGSE